MWLIVIWILGLFLSLMWVGYESQDAKDEDAVWLGIVLSLFWPLTLAFAVVVAMAYMVFMIPLLLGRTIGRMCGK